MTVFFRTVALPVLLTLVNLTVHAATPRLNGMAVHTQLGKEQFIAAVFTETPTTVARELLTAEEDKVMELRVLADNLYARSFQRMWIEGIAINAGAAEMEKHAQHLADFSNLLRIKLTTGDVLRIEKLTQQQETRVTLNGYLLGAIGDARFFDLLLRTWAGPVPLSSDFKEGLLAGGKVTPELLGRFNSITPSAERVAEVTAALRTPTPPIRPDKDLSSANDPVSTPGGAPTTGATAGEATATKNPVAVGLPEESPGAGPKAELPAAPPTPPQPEELPTADTLFNDEAIFDDEDKEAYSFTAENLLSEQIYISKLTRWTSNFVKYPRAALRNQQEGTVRITVTLRRDGRIKDVQVLEKSEHDTLNKAATRAVKSASPYPAVPEEIPGEQFLFTVPVVFKLD